MDSSKKRLIVVVGLLFAVLVIIAIVISLATRQEEIKTGIKFVIVPDSVTVKTGERSLKVDDEKTVAFEPGNYTVAFSTNHFKDLTKTVVVKSNEVTPVYVLLVASDDQGKEILKEARYSSRIERIAGFEVTAGATELTNKYPFVDKLPVTGKYYYMYACIVNTETKEYGVCVKLALQGDYYKNLALDALTKLGIDTKSVQVQFQPANTTSTGKD